MEVILELLFGLINYIGGCKKLRKGLQPVYLVYTVVSLLFTIWITVS